jgi:hypothetical protein
VILASGSGCHLLQAMALDLGPLPGLQERADGISTGLKARLALAAELLGGQGTETR